MEQIHLQTDEQGARQQREQGGGQGAEQQAGHIEFFQAAAGIPPQGQHRTAGAEAEQGNGEDHVGQMMALGVAQRLHPDDLQGQQQEGKQGDGKGGHGRNVNPRSVRRR
jgi:hypothetical protein